MVFWVLPSTLMRNLAHSFDLSEFQFYPQDMTRKFVSSSKSLTCSGHFKIEMLIPPNSPKSSKKRPLSNHHLLSNQKNISTTTVNLPTGMAFDIAWFKTQIRLATQIPKDLAGQIISNLDQTLWNQKLQETPNKSRPNHYQGSFISWSFHDFHRSLRFWGFRPPSRKWIPLNHGDHAEPPNALAWSHSHTSTDDAWVFCVSCGKYHV